MSAAAEPDWTVSADEIAQYAAVLSDLAENVKRGLMEAAKAGDGFIFRLTVAGKKYVEAMVGEPS